MSASPVVARVRAAVEPAVASTGLFCEDVQVSAAGRRSVVRVVVDLVDGPGGVTADELTEVSRAVSAAMDSADPVRGGYVLEVSTPGTGRPLTTPRHFRRAVSRLVRLVGTDGSTIAGRLIEAGEDLVLEGESGRVVVAADTIVRGEVEVELSALRIEDEES